MENESTKTAKQLKYYNLAEVEKFLEGYEDWWEKFGKHLQPVQASTTDSGSNPGGPPPPPPGHNP